MRSPAVAIAWEFRRRHRWGLLAVVVYLLAIAIVRLFVLEPGQTFTLDDAESFAIVVVVPLTATMTYLLAVFTFGLSGDLAARQSMFPSRMFTLPLTTAQLAWWPMLYGTAVVSFLWLATRFFAVWPSQFTIPVIWPAVAAAAMLAWTQALTWMPYPLPGLRVVVAVLWLAVIDIVVLLAIHFNASEPLMVALLAPQVPIAYLVARYAVARARRGDVPDWRSRLAGISRLGVLPNRREHFRSSARAQVWFEWRSHGKSLPALVGTILPFELGLFFAAGETRSLVFLIFFGVLLTPPFLASFAAATVRKPSPGESRGVTPFLATRPMTSAALVGAKLTMSIVSTLVTWVLVLVALPIALAWSGAGTVVMQEVHGWILAAGIPRVALFVLLIVTTLVVSTWKQLVQSLYIGLSGREWVVKTNAVLWWAFLVGIGPLFDWMLDSGAARATLFDALLWVPAVLVAVKMASATWVAIRLHRGALLRDTTLIAAAAAWVVAVLAMYALLVWLADTPFLPRYLFALGAILVVPLARVSAAPLALDWNRHR